MIKHDAFTAVAGDDWEIRATLTDENDNPYTTGQILWALLDDKGQSRIGTGGYTVAAIDAANGKYAIMVPASVTKPLPLGAYTDAVRIVVGGITSTLSYGLIYVMADPWSAVAAGQHTINVVKFPGQARVRAIAG